MKATRLAVSWSLREPGFEIGIEVRMRLKRSLTGRLRHVFMKFAPASGGASKAPCRFAWWQEAQVVWYVARPEFACSAVNGAGGMDCCAATAAINTAAAHAGAATAVMICRN